ncbi:MAG: DNA-3-methyladenine glycosylase 2 family protein [Spirulina sp. SIO3F2]|nr:DNA-3-methyladenine glycosylase 2 family protein [Spirulina sp. SIO3F2]
MSDLIQHHLIKVAQRLSSELAEAITALEAVNLTPHLDRPFPERLCRAVVGQQLSVKAAASIWQRVLVHAGEQPLMDFFHEAKPETLRACGLSAAKARAMGAIATTAQAGKLEGSELATLSVAERTQQLTALWGVGQWTADMMQIFYFGEPDIWPDGDTAARKTLEHLMGQQGQTQQIAAQFAPYRSYLALYLWRYLDAVPE